MYRILWSLLLVLSPAAAQTFPSTGTAWVLPGSWEAPLDPATAAQYPDAASVKAWEVAHADVAFGADYGPDANADIAAMGYMYNQSLSFEPGATEMALRKRAIASAQDYEDFFLHFVQDTVLEIDQASHSSLTPFNRRPDVVGYTSQPSHAGFWLYQTPPWNVGAWDQGDQDGGLYVLLFERFDEIELSLATGAGPGTLVVQYPSAVDAQGVVTQWSDLNITDGTAGLSQSGVMRWTPPQDWALAALHDGSGVTYGGGPYFAQTLLRERGLMYAVRVIWRADTGSIKPKLNNVQLRSWLPQVAPTQRRVPGWDAANDVDSNGYVDDAEYAALVNPSATARFRYEARVVPLGRMWSASSSWCVSNVFNPLLRQWLADEMKASWEAKGLLGAYNDDLFKTVGAAQFHVVSGGDVDELTLRVDTDAALDAYMQSYTELLRNIGQTTGSPWISANISGANLFLEPRRHGVLSGVGVYLRESYLHAAQGITGSFGLNKAWDTFALAAADKRSLIQMTTRFGRVATEGNTQENWKIDQEALLSQYYLVNVPNYSYAHFWHASFNYGSGNTLADYYYKAGVPKNMAYQPTDMLSVDIGVPANRIPDGYEAMKYMVATSANGGYSIIGDTTDTVLRHPELLPAGEVPVVPSYVFYLQRGPDHVSVPGAPQHAVLARLYSKGIVVYRTDFAGYSASFRASNSGPLSLPNGNVYRRMDRADPTNTKIKPTRDFDLDGYEGAIFMQGPISIVAPTLPSL